MATIARLLACASICACVATAISQSIGISYLWATGRLDRQKLRHIAALIQGDETIPSPSAKTPDDADPASLQVAYEDVLQQRAVNSLDLDLRESAVEKGLLDLHALATNLAEEARRFDIRREAFQAQLKVLAEGTQDTAIMEVRRTLEVMRPRQAKDQLMRLLRDEQTQAVITIIKGMPLDKRRKLLAEFKQGDEQDQLAEILHQILRGTPEVDVIQAAEKELAPNGNGGP